jgi:hypothetical protein
MQSAAITVGKLSQAALAFSAGTAVDKTYGDAPATYTATGGSGGGAVSYAVSVGTDVISVDAASGEVSFLKAGTGTITATKAADATYNAATATLTVTVAKRPLTATAQAADRTYDGTKVVTVTITAGNVVAGDTVSITVTGTADSADAGSRNVTISNIALTGTAAGNYAAPGSMADTTVTIAKATPEYDVPSGLSALAGQTLADVALPSGFSWDTDKNPETTAVGRTGDHIFKMKYTPADTGNYIVAADIPVSIAVTAKTLGITVSLNLSHEVTLSGEPAGGIILSRAGGGTAEVKAEGYTNVKWYVDDYTVVDGNSITLNAANYDVRNHQFTFRGVQGGVTYSEEIGFTVSK